VQLTEPSSDTSQSLHDAASDFQGGLQAAKAYLQHRNQQLMGDDSVQLSAVVPEASETMSVRIAQDAHALRAWRDRLASHGERYSGFETAVRLVHLQEADATMVARIEEVSRFDYADVSDGAPAYTAFRVERDFTFVQRGAEWVIDQVQLVDSTAIAPLNEPAAPSNIAVNGLVQPTVLPSDIARDNLSASAQYESQKHVEDLNGVTEIIGYSYSAMANYAITWAYGRNPAYRSFSNDCTNFISQAVYAGGWTMVSGWYQSNDVWWYNSLNQSYTWAGAENWYWFATGSGRTYILSNVWYMGLADVLQLDFDRDNNINHSMMVTAWSADEIYLTYHTTDTLNRSLSSIIAAYPSAWYYAHRT
jgi:hypothetical protein